MNNGISSINYTDALNQADALFAQVTPPMVILQIIAVPINPMNPLFHTVRV